MQGQDKNTPEWRQMAQQALHKRKMTQKELAGLVGASPATITHILRDKLGNSDFISPISKVLEISEPSQMVEYPDHYEVAGEQMPCAKLALAFGLLSAQERVKQLGQQLEKCRTALLSGDDLEIEATRHVKEMGEVLKKEFDDLDYLADQFYAFISRN